MCATLRGLPARQASSSLDEADAYAARHGLDLPPDPEAWLFDPDPPCPTEAALWTLWAPQAAAYVTRALNPADAPGHGVPGDP